MYSIQSELIKDSINANLYYSLASFLYSMLIFIILYKFKLFLLIKTAIVAHTSKVRLDSLYM